MNKRATFGHRPTALVSIAAILGIAFAGFARADDLWSAHTFSISAQPLDTALLAFSDQAKVGVLMQGGTRATANSRGVVGRSLSIDALRAILRDTGYGYKQIDKETVAIAPERDGNKTSSTGSSPSPGESEQMQEHTQSILNPSGNSQNSPTQNVPSPAISADNPPAVEEVVVTGSRIKNGLDTANPVDSIDASNLLVTGATNVTDVLATYPALLGSTTTSSTVGGGAGDGMVGLNLLNLRNLGADRTLVLVDGRRHVASLAGSQAVDINSIPQDLIERVDVLTGGVSAIYGADAVSGVVNFIMKKNFEGLTAKAQSGISQRGDAANNLASFTGGKNLFDDRGNVALSFEYASQARLPTSRRSEYDINQFPVFVSNPNAPQNLPGYTGGAPNGIPTNIPLTNIQYANISPGGAIDTNFDGIADYVTGPGGKAIPYNAGQPIPYGGLQRGGSGTPVISLAEDLTPKTERTNLNLLAHFDATQWLEFFAEGKYFNSEASSYLGPTSDYSLFIPADNPYLPTGLPALSQGGVLVSRFNFDQGLLQEQDKRDTIRTVTGIKGTLSPHASYEVSYVFGQTSIETTMLNDRLTDRYDAAIDAVIDPATGNTTCRVNLDPAAEPSTTFKPGQCIPLNIFGSNVASSAALNFIHANTTSHTKLRQQVVSGSLSGDSGQIFSLPGGPLGIAVGGEYRKESSDFQPDPRAAANDTYFTGSVASQGAFDVKETYGELSAPILRDQPFADRLNLGAAVRLSDYSTIGHTTTWKLDESYAPIRDVTFNASTSLAIRAPNIGELFDPPTGTQNMIVDPCNQNQVRDGTQYRIANCEALLKSLGVADPSTYNDPRPPYPFGTEGGNPNLKPEKAKSWTAGILLQPSLSPGLRLRVDWYDVEIHQAINTARPQEVAQLCVDQPTLDNAFCRSITRQSGNNGNAAPGNILSFAVVPENVAQFHTSGLDVDISHRLPTDRFGTFSLELQANYLDSLTFIDIPGGDVTNRVNEGVPSFYVAPRYSGNMTITWTKGPITVSYNLALTSRTLRYSNLQTDSDPDIVAPEYLHVPGLMQHDVFASYDVSREIQVYGGITNLLDQQPGYGEFVLPASGIGRAFFLGARARIPKL